MQHFDANSLVSSGKAVNKQTKIVDSQVLSSRKPPQMMYLIEQTGQSQAMDTTLTNRSFMTAHTRHNQNTQAVLDMCIRLQSLEVSYYQGESYILNILQHTLSNVKTLQVNHQLLHRPSFLLLFFLFRRHGPLRWRFLQPPSLLTQNLR